jgi:ornithine cyclodeaminase
MELIKRENLDNLIKFEDVFTKTKRAYQLFSQGKTITPPFTVFTIPESKGSVHFKCGYVPGEKYFAMKYSGAFYGNEQIGISNFLGLFTVFNAQTGEVEAIIDDKGYLTDYRTGVAGAIATSTLANPESKTVAMIGTGVQARMQLMALLKVMPNIQTLQVWGRSEKGMATYIEEVKSLYPNLNVIACKNAQEAVRDADIIYTVTYSEKPIIQADWIKKGAHITAVGACEPSMQELDPKILAMADIVCTDSKDACAKNGELHHALDMGHVDENNVFELGEAITSKIQRDSTDITVCDLVGIGFQDAVIASCVMNEFEKHKNNTSTQETK